MPRNAVVFIFYQQHKNTHFYLSGEPLDIYKKKYVCISLTLIPMLLNINNEHSICPQCPLKLYCKPFVNHTDVILLYLIKLQRVNTEAQ